MCETFCRQVGETWDVFLYFRGNAIVTKLLWCNS